VIDKHERALKSLKAIRSFNENVIEIRSQPFTYRINLRDVGAAHPDHFWRYLRRIALLGYDATTLDQPVNRRDHAAGELLIDFAHIGRWELHLDNTRACSSCIERGVERRQTSHPQRNCPRTAECDKRHFGIKRRLYELDGIGNKPARDRQVDLIEARVTLKQSAWARHVRAGRICPPPLEFALDHRFDLARIADKNDPMCEIGDELKPIVRQLERFVDYLNVEQRIMRV
jgi:hypothetical protein